MREPLEDDQIAVYLPLFNAKYPDIRVNIVRDSTGIITAKLLAEMPAPAKLGIEPYDHALSANPIG